MENELATRGVFFPLLLSRLDRIHLETYFIFKIETIESFGKVQIILPKRLVPKQ